MMITDHLDNFQFILIFRFDCRNTSWCSGFLIPHFRKEDRQANRIKGITVEIGGDTTKLSPVPDRADPARPTVMPPSSSLF